MKPGNLMLIERYWNTETDLESGQNRVGLLLCPLSKYLNLAWTVLIDDAVYWAYDDEIVKHKEDI